MRQDLSIQQRQSHLLSMGVAQWYVRTTLLGAKSSPEHLFEEVVTEERIPAGDTQSAPKDLLKSLKGKESIVAVNETEIVSNSVSSSSQRAIDIAKPSGTSVDDGVLPSKVEGQIPSVEKSIDERINSVSSELSPVSAFSINCYFSTGFLVFSECSNQSGIRRESQLLCNIFKSLGHLKAFSSELEYYQSFNWPVFHSLNLQSSQSVELDEAVKLWLKDISKQQKKIFYFGESQLGLQELVKGYLSEMGFYSFKYSLQDMLQIPIRKKEVWKQLQSYSFQ